MFSALHTVKIRNKRVAKNRSEGQGCKPEGNLAEGLENPMRKYPVEEG